MGRIRAIEFHQWRGQVWKFLLEFGHAQCGWCHGSNDGRRGDRGARRVGDDHLVMRNPQDADHLGPLKVWAMDYTRTLFSSSHRTSIVIRVALLCLFFFVSILLFVLFCFLFTDFSVGTSLFARIAMKTAVLTQRVAGIQVVV